MDVVRVLVLIAIGCAIWAGWQLHSFPGGRRFTFSSEHAGEREHLTAARRKWREAESTSYRRVAAAKAQEHRAQTLHDERIRRAQEELQRVRWPGRGELVEERGAMSLHQHVLLIADEEIPLVRLCIRFEQDRQESHIYATRPDGSVRLTSFLNTAHEEGGVRRFAVRIENAVAAENTFRAQQKALTAQAEKNLKEALADTGARDTARLHLAQATSLHKIDHRRKTARAELDAARKRWQSLTGKLPH
ncbi:hypothetical protein Scani_34070 [Streptomyces caniferus]|uniref:Uncharacterized protein n=1 Tax=Streptomyces caniferus TaxID=285557 RepID=A0A640S7B9_9ACTN|nr:hypothetical protein [Streptomyces caniferus]GFE07139.1 hypothetical protein Scani_34070 [Streptomyces caniferus]